MSALLRALTVAAAALGLAAAPAAAQLDALAEIFTYDEARPAAGVWVGEIETPGGGPLFAQVVIDASGGAEAPAWSVDVTAPALGAMGAAAGEVSIDGALVHFGLPLHGAPTRFMGRVDPTGQRLFGAIRLSQGDIRAQEGTFRFVRTVRPGDLREPMAFTGDLVAATGRLGISIVLARTPGNRWVGHLDVPAQGLRGFPLTDIEQEGDRLRALVPVPGNARIDVALDGAFRSIKGTFAQGGLELAIDFPRDASYAPRPLARPQHPAPPFPYRTLEIVATHPAGHRLAGTLTLPDPAEHGQGPYPAALLISGSGQQDRDETIFGHKPFLVIADRLTRAGIAVARFDDRGVGGSPVNNPALLVNATSRDFASDTAAEVQALRGREEIDRGRVGLIGHSEGALIASMVAADDPAIAFIVLMAGPGVRGDALVQRQSEMAWALLGADAATIERLSNRYVAFLDLVEQSAPRPALREALRVLSTLEIEARLVPETVDTELKVGAALAIHDNAWMRFFLAYDPSSDLGRVRCPVLALNGVLDRQVCHEQNLDAIERVLRQSGADATVKRYAGLNHLFQPATSGAASEYAAIETTIAEGVLSDLAAWIRAREAPRAAPAPAPR